MVKKRACIFISGNGSNLKAIIKNSRDSNFPIKVSLVISNNEKAFGLNYAKIFSIPYKVINKEMNKFQNETLRLLSENKIELICLAGFMKILTKSFLRRFKGKIINIHPSLLPKFGGKGMYGDHVHEAVIRAHETESGITIHYVNEKYDDGTIIFQSKLKIKNCETVESLSKKIKKLELRYYPEIINRIVSNSL